MQSIYTGRPSPETLDYLLRRRSGKTLAEPGPSMDQVETILRAASRVPDHGKLCPWYFAVLAGDARVTAGTLLGKAWQMRDPDASTDKIALEAARFLRAPVVIAVVSTIRVAKHPEWEQVLSAGAVCMNLCLAANASGFATNWLTEWYSYDPNFLAPFGIDGGDRVAGFIYIGTDTGEAVERVRPDTDTLTTWWEPGRPLKK